MIAALVLVLFLAALVAAALARSAGPLTPVGDEPKLLAIRIDGLLPQTQCGLCGFGGCRPYADAIAATAAGINLCPPGGVRTLSHLARLLGRPPLPLADAVRAARPPGVAWVDERACIGCLKCVRACPVDAILGAAGTLHAVIPDLCTGCELCIPTCPVDCIDLVPAPRAPAWHWTKPLTQRSLSA